MTAEQIWANQGGLLEVNRLGGWLLVDLYQMRERFDKPSKNLRFRYQVMMNNNEQSCVAQFRSITLAQKWLRAEICVGELDELAKRNKARLFF